MDKNNNDVYFKATESDLIDLSPGSVIMINIDDEDDYIDFAVFLNYDKITQEIICLDTYNKKIQKFNLASYDNCYILNQLWIQDNYVNLVEGE